MDNDNRLACTVCVAEFNANHQPGEFADYEAYSVVFDAEVKPADTQFFGAFGRPVCEEHFVSAAIQLDMENFDLEAYNG